MEINNDVNAVIIDLKLYNELLRMADFAISEVRSNETIVRRINKHVCRFNPYIAEAQKVGREVIALSTKTMRDKLKSLYRTGGKQVYYREDKDVYWPVTLGKQMKYDWTMVRMKSATEHRKFSSYEIWQHLNSFVVEGDVRLCPNPNVPGSFMRALTEAERNAEWERNQPPVVKKSKPYNLKVIITGDSLTVHKERSDGEVVVEPDDQEEPKLYLAKIRSLMNDCVDEHLIADLYRIADDTFGGDRYFGQLLVEQK